MSAWVVWAPILTAVAGGAGALAVLEWRRRRRWAAEDDAYQPILPPPVFPPALLGTPVITSDHAPRGSGYVMNGEHGRVLVLHPDDLERITRPGRRPLPYPRWPNTAATAAAAGEVWDACAAYLPPLEDDEGGRRGD